MAASARLTLTDHHWTRVAVALGSMDWRGPRRRSTRTFVEGVLWILRTGAPWRDLPVAFGRWATVYRRYRRWALAGRWSDLWQRLEERCDFELLLIDSTIIKAHAHAAGALKRLGGQAEHALGRSRGGFTTKLHLVSTEKGRVRQLVLTGGEVNDITQARQLVPASVPELGEAHTVVGDRAYDSDAFIEHLEGLKMSAAIPSRANRRQQRALDESTYKKRNIIERLFGRLKSFRRVATRYDKTVQSFAGFVVVAICALTLVRWVP